MTIHAHNMEKLVSKATKHIVHKMQSNYIAAMHDVKERIIAIQVLSSFLSITNRTAKWKENEHEVFVWL